MSCAAELDLALERQRARMSYDHDNLTRLRPSAEMGSRQ